MPCTINMPAVSFSRAIANNKEDNICGMYFGNVKVLYIHMVLLATNNNMYKE